MHFPLSQFSSEFLIFLKKLLYMRLVLDHPLDGSLLLLFPVFGPIKGLADMGPGEGRKEGEAADCTANRIASSMNDELLIQSAAPM